MLKLPKDQHHRIQKKLLQWFRENQRPLPWRQDYSPYSIWISEIMLQQTQMKRVVDVFQKFTDRFPDIRSLAAASREEILKYWEGMGYYSRVRYIHQTANILDRDFNGEFPRDYKTLLTLPGIGLYTAGAIMSIAFNEDFPLVDGNVERVFARMVSMQKPVKEKESQAFIWATAEKLIPKGQARYFNQALMELGATVCLPKRTICSRCPVREDCKSFQLGIVDEIPIPGKRKKITPIETVLGVLSHEGKVLIRKRPALGLLPDLWEFPGTEVNAGETLEQACIREFKREFGLNIFFYDKIDVIQHHYTSFKVTLHSFLCQPQYEPVMSIPLVWPNTRWVRVGQLDDFAFPSANRRLINVLGQKKLHSQLL
ncbi:MAG: A/G-specific adenine glycosylase [Thermodesulfobacteriota bacterium]|nr:A/G-specific adenine glycosylase [Thermodesulfobacteriota bacterium]